MSIHEDESTSHEIPSTTINPEEEDTARDQDMEPGSNRYSRTCSMKQDVEILVSKRQSQRVLMPAVAQVEDDSETAYILILVEEMRTTYESALEFINAVQ